MNNKERTKITHLNRKQSVLSHYGNGKCQCIRCGFKDIRALSIDHIDGGGSEHRRSIKTRNIYNWLIENNFPDGFQTLCMNCQFIKRYTKDDKIYAYKKLKTLAKRIRAWVDLREQGFNIRDVKIGLGLTDKEVLNIRVELCRLNKQGIIKRRMIGYYSKCVQPINVFRNWR